MYYKTDFNRADILITSKLRIAVNQARENLKKLLWNWHSYLKQIKYLRLTNTHTMHT